MSDDVTSSVILEMADRETGNTQASQPPVRNRFGPAEHERFDEHHHTELATCNRINRLLLELTRELIGRVDRKSLERIVCERLAASELYQFAWIGDLELDGNQLVRRTSAGVDDKYVETNLLTAPEMEADRGPGGRALRTEEIQATQTLHADPAFEPWHEAARDHDVQAAAAVPLIYKGTSYGCLAVYTTRPLGFSQREQAAFEMFGEAVAFAIHAIETRRLLFADAVLELEFRVTDSDQFLVRHSERFECDLSVEGCVTNNCGAWLLYVEVEGVAPAVLSEAADERDEIERVRVVRANGDGGLLEYRCSESSLFGILGEAGVKLCSSEANAGTGRFVVEAPQGADVREVVGRIADICPETKLVAQRERDRPVVESGVPGGPLEKLTDRQREALEAAYHAGYFEWPRESTADEVAESMGIAAPTLSRHFRRAQKHLVSAFFGPTDGTTQRPR